MICKMVIKCAGCGQPIGIYDGKSTIDKTIRCKSCMKYNRFHTDTGMTEIVNKPVRMTGSGAIFY